MLSLFMPAASSRRLLRKRYLTIMEILIAISILALAMGMTAIGIRQVLRDQKFKTESYEVLSTLRLAQQIMLILNTDVHVIFKSEDNKGFSYRIALDDKLKENWHKQITKQRPVLTEIRSINFVDALGPSGKSNELDIRFLSGGSTISQGVMRLSTAPPGTPYAPQAFICFPGFPHHLELTSDPEKDKACNVQDQKKFNNGITQITVSEVNDKITIYKELDKEEKEGAKAPTTGNKDGGSKK